MKIQQLRFFSTISKYENYSNAAVELYVSQSSLSKQIIAMEDELQVKLFDRTTRQIHLTEIGTRLLPMAEALLKQYDDMLSQIEEYQKGITDIIRVGGLPILYPYGLSAALFAFEKKYPQYHLDIVETLTPEVLNMLLATKLDIGIIRLNLHHYKLPENTEAYPLIDDRQVLVVPAKHPLAKRGHIKLAEAAHEEFIQLNTDTIMSAFHLHKLEKHVPGAKLTLTAMKMDSIKDCIIQKGCVSLMMKRVAESYYEQEQIALLDLDEEDTMLTLYLVVRKEVHEEPLRRLLKFLLENYKEKDPGNYR